MWLNAVPWGKNTDPVYIRPRLVRMAPEKQARVRLVIISSGVSKAAVREIRESFRGLDGWAKTPNRRSCGLGGCIAATCEPGERRTKAVPGAQPCNHKTSIGLPDAARE